MLLHISPSAFAECAALLDAAASVSGGFRFDHFLWALILGGLSAISLPLGSLTGLMFRPGPRLTGALAAFGGGALVAALTVELVAPTALAVAGGGAAHGGHGDPAHALLAVLGGMLVGGVLFFILDALVNEKGGFLRHTVTSMAYISKAKQRRAKDVVDWLGKVAILRSVPAQGVQRMVDVVRPKDFLPSEVLFEEGDEGDRVYFIVSGEVSLRHQGKPLATLGAGDVLGEIALLTGAHRTATAKASGNVRTLTLRKEDFDHLRREIPELETACRDLASVRLDEIQHRQSKKAEAVNAWLERAKAALHTDIEAPTPGELQQEREKHYGAPLAVWLGIMLDGIPESFVIGAGFLGLVGGYAAQHGVEALDGLTLMQVIPYTLIAGLFLSNFPEAMSSSVGMRNAGWSAPKVFFLWFVLMIMTAAGAGAGYWLGEVAPHDLVVGIEGLAAGAMLTMILTAMLPEAMHLAGSKITGLAGLFGFLAAVSFKLLE